MTEEVSTPARVTKRTKLIAGGAALALILAGGGTAIAATADHNAWVSQTEDYAQDVAAAQEAAAGSDTAAATAYDNARSKLVIQIDTDEAYLAQSEGRVLDNAVRETLRAELDAAIALRETPVVYVTEETIIEALSRDSIFSQGSRPEVTVVTTTGSTPSVTDLNDAEAAVKAASDAVRVAETAWAHQALTEAITAAEAVYEASPNVTNGTRELLRANLDAAIEARDADPLDLGNLNASLVNVPLNSADVAASQATWQAEQDAAAAEDQRQAEAVAAAQAAANRKPATSSGSSNSGGSSSSNSGGSSSGSRNTGSGSGSSGSSGSSSGSGNSGSSGSSSSGSSGSSSGGPQNNGGYTGSHGGPPPAGNTTGGPSICPNGNC